MRTTESRVAVILLTVATMFATANWLFSDDYTDSNSLSQDIQNQNKNCRELATQCRTDEKNKCLQPQAGDGIFDYCCGPNNTWRPSAYKITDIRRLGFCGDLQEG